jgi:hypothetical protein
MENATSLPNVLGGCKITEGDLLHQLDRLAERLAAPVRPGHPDYISKQGASDVLRRLINERNR